MDIRFFACYVVLITSCMINNLFSMENHQQTTNPEREIDGSLGNLSAELVDYIGQLANIRSQQALSCTNSANCAMLHQLSERSRRRAAAARESARERERRTARRERFGGHSNW